MKRLLRLMVYTNLAIFSLACGLVAQQGNPADNEPDKAKSQASDERPKLHLATSTEREIALVKLAEIDREINLAGLAYKKARNEKVRQLASTLEATLTEKRALFERLAKAPVQAMSPASERPQRPVVEPKPTANRADPPIRRGQGSQDPSTGARPDGGSLDQYNRNTVNPKQDSEEDTARLKKALSDQSTPTDPDKKRSVEKPAVDGELTFRTPPQVSDWAVMLQKISEHRLTQTRKHLAEKGGADFDECYLRMQMAACDETIASGEVYTSFVSGEAHKLIEQDANHAIELRQKAHELLGELKGMPAPDADEK